MLITFKSPAAPDVMMLENLAEYLLGIIGKPLGERGVITHDEIPSAIEKLEAGVMTYKQQRAEYDVPFHEGEEGHEHHEIPIAGAARVSVSRHASARAEGEQGYSLGRLSVHPRMFWRTKRNTQRKNPHRRRCGFFSSYQRDGAGAANSFNVAGRARVPHPSMKSPCARRSSELDRRRSCRPKNTCCPDARGKSPTRWQPAAWPPTR